MQDQVQGQAQPTPHATLRDPSHELGMTFCGAQVTATATVTVPATAPGTVPVPGSATENPHATPTRSTAP
jgi:hypothetical protein